MSEWAIIAGIVGLSGFLGFLLGCKAGIGIARRAARAAAEVPDYRHRIMGPCLKDCSALRRYCGHILCPYKPWVQR